MKYKSFEELEFWQLGRKFRIEISRMVKRFPNSEKYNPTDQLRRSSRSICDNIAEGHGRFHFQENIQYCRIARGSLEEAFNQLITALDEGYISNVELSEMRSLRDQILRICNGYIRFLTKQKKTITNNH